MSNIAKKQAKKSPHSMRAPEVSLGIPVTASPVLVGLD
jgi:hypothetical protein